MVAQHFVVTEEIVFSFVDELLINKNFEFTSNFWGWNGTQNKTLLHVDDHNIVIYLSNHNN